MLGKNELSKVERVPTTIDSPVTIIFRFLEGPTLWEMFTQFFVPATLAIAAALVVVGQIRQLDRHRSEDRRSRAIEELTSMMIAAVELVNKTIEAAVHKVNGLEYGERLTQSDRFTLNLYFIRAQSLLAGDDIAVALWTMQEQNRVFDEMKRITQKEGWVCCTVR